MVQVMQCICFMCQDHIVVANLKGLQFALYERVLVYTVAKLKFGTSSVISKQRKLSDILLQEIVFFYLGQ